MGSNPAVRGARYNMYTDKKKIKIVKYGSPKKIFQKILLKLSTTTTKFKDNCG